MSLGDVILMETDNGFGPNGSQAYVVEAGGVATINAGEPVVVDGLGTSGDEVKPCPDLGPVVGTDYLVGISTTTSNDTASAAGSVQVVLATPNQIWLANADDATAVNTQAKYNDLVGSRVLFDLDSGVYTMLVADSANNGCVIVPLDITKAPGKIAFRFRAGASYLA